MAHPQLDDLFHYCVSTAQDLLKKRGGFLPFAAKIDAGGELQAVAVDNGEEYPEPHELVGLCEKVLKQFASVGEAQAVALCYDALVSSKKGAEDKQDAIAVALEHSNGECILVYVPYRKEGPAGATFEQATAQSGELKFFVQGQVSQVSPGKKWKQWVNVDFSLFLALSGPFRGLMIGPGWMSDYPSSNTAAVAPLQKNLIHVVAGDNQTELVDMKRVNAHPDNVPGDFYVEDMSQQNPFPNVRPLDLNLEEEGTGELVRLLDEYLEQFAWARRTPRIWIAESIPPVFGLFLVELDPLNSSIDKYVWVFVGDVPPAYVSTALAKTPRQALDGYISEMGAWVDAVQQGESVEGLIPVNAPETRRNAEALDSRLSFLKTRVRPELGEGNE